MNTFSGFTSRWTIALSCAAASPARPPGAAAWGGAGKNSPHAPRPNRAAEPVPAELSSCQQTAGRAGSRFRNRDASRFEKTLRVVRGGHQRLDVLTQRLVT